MPKKSAIHEELVREAEKEERITKKADRLFALRMQRGVPDEENIAQWAKDKEKLRSKENKKRKVDDAHRVSARAKLVIHARHPRGGSRRDRD